MVRIAPKAIGFSGFLLENSGSRRAACFGIDTHYNSWIAQLKTGRGWRSGNERIRLAYQLQVRHGITAEDLAKILGLEERYDLWLRRLKCTGMQAKAPQRPIEGAFERQAELQRLLDGDQLPDKSQGRSLDGAGKSG